MKKFEGYSFLQPSLTSIVKNYVLWISGWHDSQHLSISPMNPSIILYQKLIVTWL